MQTEYCIRKAESILAVMPDNEMANYYKALYMQILAGIFSRQYAGVEATEEEARKVIDAVLSSREAARQLTAYLPTNGYFQALYARQLNLSAWYDFDVEIPDIIRAFETAHARFPNVPQVTRLCLQAFSEILDVDRDELSAGELERLENTFRDMGRALLEQKPAQAAEIYPILYRVLPSADSLIEMTPPRLLCYEQLYKMLFRDGDYQNCHRVLERMKEVNRTRLTRFEEGGISLYDLVRTHPDSREEMTARIIRKEGAVASVSGNWEEYSALRSKDYAMQRQLCLQQLSTARSAADEGELHQAIRIGRRLRREWPGNPEVQTDLAEWLMAVGNYAEALDSLQTLVWLEDVPLECLRRGAGVAGQLVSVRRLSQSTEMINDILTIRMAAADKNLDARQLWELIARLEQETERGHFRNVTSSVYDHLAYFYAGRYLENKGEKQRAVKFYREVLARCPLHYQTMLRVMALPADIARELQYSVQNILEEARINLDDLENDLVDLAPGVKLRSLIIEPSEIQPHEAVIIIAAVELTGDVTAIPPLTLKIPVSEGTEIRWTLEPTRRNWQITPERMKIGRIVQARTEFAPRAAAFEKAQVLPEGPVHIAVPGGGRDSRFIFYHPGFTVRRGSDSDE